jgi:hypothetical protein
VTPGDQLLVAEGAPAMGLPAEQAGKRRSRTQGLPVQTPGRLVMRSNFMTGL